LRIVKEGKGGKKEEINFSGEKALLPTKGGLAKEKKNSTGRGGKGKRKKYQLLERKKTLITDEKKGAGLRQRRGLLMTTGGEKHSLWEKRRENTTNLLRIEGDL